MGKPDVFILGAQRAGTSSLALCLLHHPQIAAPKCQYQVTAKINSPIHMLTSDGIYIGKFAGPGEMPLNMPWSVGAYMKETSYFSRFYSIMDIEDYYSFFDNNGTGKISYDASPEYFGMEGVEERIKDTCPDARFIVLLRNPVERAWSHYWHEVKVNETETLLFEKAIQRRTICFCDDYFFSYLSRGHYAEHLERWFSLFPKHRFKILFMEEFFSDTNNFVDLVGWLGLRPADLNKYPVDTTLPDGYPDMNVDTENMLREYYEPHNERLKELLGRELPW